VDPNYPKIIFVLTDGDTESKGDVIAEVTRHKEEATVHAIGIGTDVDVNLVKGMANAGNGSVLFVKESSKIATTVEEFCSQLILPSVREIVVDWGENCEVIQSPHKIATVFKGQRIVVFGTITSGEVGDFLKMSGVLDANTKQIWEVPVIKREGAMIQKFGAFRMIRDLQEGRSKSHAEGKGAEHIKSEIIKLGIEHQLASNYTSFIAVEEYDGSTDTTMQLQQIQLVAPTPPPSKRSNVKSSQQAEYDYLFKFLFVGEDGVGKCRLVTAGANTNPAITMDFRIMTITVDSQTYKLQLWFWSGVDQSKFSYYRGAHVIFVVYDITKRETFENISKWLKNIELYAMENVTRILIGNKSDLEEQRKVTVEEGKIFAEDCGMLFCETNALDRSSVDDALKLAVTEFIKSW